MGVPVSLPGTNVASKPMPAGLNAAVVTYVGPVEESENTFEKNEDGTPKIRRQCKVTFTNPAGEIANDWLTPSFHDRAKLTKVIKGVTGSQTIPQPFDMQAKWPGGLDGMPCQVLIAPHVKNAKGYINAKILAYMAPAAAAAAPAHKVYKGEAPEKNLVNYNGPSGIPTTQDVGF